MSLSTPILYPISAFDATVDKTVNFTVIGGDQVIGSRILVNINNTYENVYDYAIESYGLETTILANNLTNGVYYTAKIKTYGVGDNVQDDIGGSNYSDSISFYCYTTPTLTWDNQRPVIDESSPTFTFTYSQAENEELYSYIINLYDQSQTLIESTGIKYVSSSSPTIVYKATGLIDNNNYYIEANGETINNTQITTGKILFSVKYDEPYSKQGFIAVNDACNGWITLINNIIDVKSESFPENPIYVKNNTAVDVRNDEYYVKWYNISQKDDFCIRIWGYDFNSNKNIFTYSQDNIPYNITLIRRDGYDYDSLILQNYYELQVRINDNQPLFIYSNYIDEPNSEDKIFICIKRINNIYSLYVENLGS